MVATPSKRDFDLAKQIRIMERNRRIGRRLDRERVARERRTVWGCVWLAAFVILTAGAELVIGVVRLLK